MYAYVINLARSTDRRAHMVAQLKKTALKYEFITAVDGRDLDISDRSLAAEVIPSKFPANTVATVLSHLSVYERILSDGHEAALVLEDDVLLPADVDQVADSVAAQLVGSEVGLLSYDCYQPVKMSRDGTVELNGGRQLALPIDGRQPGSGGAYVITREACERLLKHSLPVRLNPDNWWEFYEDGVLDRIRCVVPLTVRKAARLNSTQGSYSLGNGLMYRLLWPLVKRRIPVLHQVLAFRRQRIYDRWSKFEIVDAPFIRKPSRLD